MHKRDISLEECDLKFAKGDAHTFEGYLSVWDRVDSYGDTVRKGAFLDTLAGRKRMPPMLLNHDSWGTLPPGLWKSMEEDDRGLRVVGELTPGHKLADDLYASMKHGSLTGLSIGFRTIKSEELESGGRILLKIQLIEGSIVTMPAEDEARIDTVKTAIAELESISDCERYLREAGGLSRDTAKHFMARLKDVAVREAPDVEAEIADLKAQILRYELRNARADRLARIQSLIQ